LFGGGLEPPGGFEPPACGGVLVEVPLGLVSPLGVVVELELVRGGSASVLMPPRLVALFESVSR
jgi:hypothetical protein